MRLRPTIIGSALSLGGIALLATDGARAQDIRVNVTGSNIKRTDVETAAPIEIITRADIQASGLQTISDVVRQITANNNGSIAPSFTNGFSPSSSAVSLRGLGPNNTLVLLNGRRLANFGLADDTHVSYVDLQQIPFEAVERIEVLKDGASAIYGADAVAGVVNVILRQQYTGTTVTGTVGTDRNGSANQYKGALTLGMGDLTTDRYNVFLTIDGQRQDAIPMNTGRAYIGTNDLRLMGLPDTRLGNPTSGFGNNSLLGNVRPVAAANPNGDPIDRFFRSLPGACDTVNQDGSFCRWEFKDYTDMLPQIERFNAFARGSYLFSPAFEGYAELSWFQVKTQTRERPMPSRINWYNPATDSVQSTANVYLPVGHPDNPFSANGQVARLYYADVGLGGRAGKYETDTQRYLAGIKGSHWGWDWDAAALYIRSDTTITLSNVPTYDRWLQGLAGSGPYGFYRIGASAPLNDPAIYDWIAPDFSWTTVSENTIIDAKASRDLGRLDGGPMALAVGYEFRRESLTNPGAPGTATGNILGQSYVTAQGSRNVNAVYAELYAPVLKNLELTAAIRLDDYSDFGHTVNPKLGVKWNVLPQLVLRGTYQTAFRAPGPYEIQPSTLSGGAILADPVRCPVTRSTADCSSQFQILTFGNPHVQPETSTTYTAGLIWEPVPGLSGTLDYWNIKSRNQITVADLPSVLNDPASFPSSTVIRDTNNLPGIPDSGSLLVVKSPWENGNSVETDGIDLDITWRQALKSWGTLTTQVQWTHILNYVQTFANGQAFSYAGTQGNYGVSSAGGTPDDRMNVILGWNRGPWNVTGTVRYVSDYQSIYYQGAYETEGCLSLLDKEPDCHVASFTTLDMAASYSGFKNWQIFGSIINVFNRIAPFNPAAVYGGVNFNYNYAFSGATGTQFNLGARYTFQ